MAHQNDSLTFLAVFVMESLPMSQSDLLLLLPLAWQNYLDNQARFGAYKARYTTGLAAEALARLEAAKKLPAEDARDADAEMTRGELLVQGQEFLDVWQQLEGYIEEAYPAAPAYKAMREAAGYRYYEGAADHDWSAMTRLVEDSLLFVSERKAVLLAQGDMPAGFEAVFVAEAGDVTTLLRTFNRQTQQAQQGTGKRNAALLACYVEFQKVNQDAQRIFRRQPELARLFQMDYLRGIVSGTAQAGVRGTLTLADGAPAPNVTVGVPALVEPVSTLTDADGRYALALAAGTYTLTFGGAGYVGQQRQVTVEAGVKRRVDGVMEREG